MRTAEEISRQYLGGDAAAIDLEREILRHMEHHRKRAIAAEREECAAIASLIAARSQEDGDKSWYVCADNIAALIRRRGQPEG